jgi:hypothetical protein
MPGIRLMVDTGLGRGIMTIYYSVLLSLEEDASLTDLPAQVVQSLVSSAKSIDGVSDAVVSQLVPGDLLYPDDVL